MQLAYTNGSARCKLGGATNTKIKWKCMFNFVLQRIRRTGLVPAQMQVVVVHRSPCTHTGPWNESRAPVSVSTAVREPPGRWVTGAGMLLSSSLPRLLWSLHAAPHKPRTEGECQDTASSPKFLSFAEYSLYAVPEEENGKLIRQLLGDLGDTTCLGVFTKRRRTATMPSWMS